MIKRLLPPCLHSFSTFIFTKGGISVTFLSTAAAVNHTKYEFMDKKSPIKLFGI